MQNGYAPASAPLVGKDPRPPRSSVGAILLGGLVVDVVGSILVVGTLASAVAALAMGGGRGADIEALTASWGFLGAAAGAGSLLVVTGGYTAAWWARRRPIAHALGAGILSLALSIGGVVLQRDASPLWFDVAMLALHLPLAMLGGYLYARTQRWA